MADLPVLSISRRGQAVSDAVEGGLVCGLNGQIRMKGRRLYSACAAAFPEARIGSFFMILSAEGFRGDF